MLHRSGSLRFLLLFLCGACALVLSRAAAAQVGTVKSEQKISATAGGFTGDLEPLDGFGGSVAFLGDLDGDGVTDLAVGAPTLHGQGDAWILFLNADGTVKAEQRIGAGSGGFSGALDAGDLFGNSVASLGDLDGDGVADLAVGAWGDDDGGTDQGALWILFLNGDGTVKSEQKISAAAGAFAGHLDANDGFGVSCAGPGDLDGDGIVDLVAGAPGDDDAVGFAFERGALWVLFLNADGTVKSEQKISEVAGGFGGDLDNEDFFGSSVAAAGDLDGDGVMDLVVGAPLDDDGINGNGAIWILFLHPDGTVKTHRKVSTTAGGFGGDLGSEVHFGTSVASPGDLDGDGVADLAVGAGADDDGGSAHNDNLGAVWILFLNGPPCFTLDFETEDDFATPLVNGQRIDTEFGAHVTITSAGANAGAAIFDSTPGGPNDPSPDEDMLVGHRELLLLQDDARSSQGTPGIFDVPVDDPDGGDLIFDFRAQVEARSMVLVDLDPPPNQGATVTLFDDDARTRVYTVPPGWTGTFGVPGLRTLDLTTLAPQIGNAPGFRQATASETPGFVASRVRRIVVHLTGSGAIDDLAWCSPLSALTRASASVRNGSGVNPLVLSSLSTPLLGGTFDVRLDCTGHASGLARLMVKRQPVSIPTRFGELLIGGPSYLERVLPHSGSAVSFAESLPMETSLVGLPASAQGLCSGSPGARLTNALDIVLGF